VQQDTHRKSALLFRFDCHGPSRHGGGRHLVISMIRLGTFFT